MPEFVSLAQLLRPQVPVFYEPELIEEVPADASSPLPEAFEEKEEQLREVRFFRAHLREALDRELEVLLGEIARKVLCRELILAPAQISSVINEVLERYRQCEPLRVRAHPLDVQALRECDIPIFSDDALGRGDAIVELRNGSVDLSLTTRLDEIIAKARA